MERIYEVVYFTPDRETERFDSLYKAVKFIKTNGGETIRVLEYRNDYVEVKRYSYWELKTIAEAWCSE